MSKPWHRPIRGVRLKSGKEVWSSPTYIHERRGWGVEMYDFGVQEEKDDGEVVGDAIGWRDIDQVFV